ncbi:hypothetical protein Sros01_72410 [Streptomyces roseochromogenus]|nr:hypothetical protein Sros01_72410 [Streptomyces roseochromogenus]
MHGGYGLDGVVEAVSFLSAVVKDLPVLHAGESMLDAGPDSPVFGVVLLLPRAVAMADEADGKAKTAKTQADLASQEALKAVSASAKAAGFAYVTAQAAVGRQVGVSCLRSGERRHPARLPVRHHGLDRDADRADRAGIEDDRRTGYGYVPVPINAPATGRPPTTQQTGVMIASIELLRRARRSARS